MTGQSEMKIVQVFQYCQGGDVTRRGEPTAPSPFTRDGTSPHSVLETLRLRSGRTAFPAPVDGFLPTQARWGGTVREPPLGGWGGARRISSAGPPPAPLRPICDRVSGPSWGWIRLGGRNGGKWRRAAGSGESGVWWGVGRFANQPYGGWGRGLAAHARPFDPTRRGGSALWGGRARDPPTGDGEEWVERVGCVGYGIGAGENLEHTGGTF